MKLAEIDLERRGAGDIFGTQQHGFDDLKFANWTNMQLIAKAKRISDQVEKLKYTSFLAKREPPSAEPADASEAGIKNSAIPLANWLFILKDVKFPSVLDEAR